MAIETRIAPWGVRTFRRIIRLDAWGKHAPKPVEVTIEIDIDKIMTQLGNKALRNKSKRSRILGVVVKVEPE